MPLAEFGILRCKSAPHATYHRKLVVTGRKAATSRFGKLVGIVRR